MKTSADQLMAISRPRGVARWMALGLLAGALGGCSTVSSWFSSDTKPKPQELGANPGLLAVHQAWTCLLYTSPSPRDRQKSRMPSSA